MTIRTYAMAFGLAVAVVGASAIPTLAQTNTTTHMKKKMHHAMRGHAAYARAPAPQECWIGSDKGPIDRGVYGYYGACNSPGAVPAQDSVWGPNRSGSYGNGASEY
jgi:hypothetical protein